MLFTNIVLPLEEPAAAADEVHHGQQINAAIQDIPSPYHFFFTFSLTTRLTFSSSKVTSALLGNRYTKRQSIAASPDRNLIQYFQKGGGRARVGRGNPF